MGLASPATTPRITAFRQSTRYASRSKSKVITYWKMISNDYKGVKSAMSD